MASHVDDTWKAMCHNAWQRHACVTHGMPCVNMHGSLPCLYKGLTWAVGRARQGRAQDQSVGVARRRGREGRRRRRKGKRKGGKERRKGGKERRKERRKEKKKGEEETKKKEEEEGVLRSEQPRTAKNPELHYKRWVSSYTGYFTPRGRVMAYGFRPVFRANLYVVWFVCDCVMVKD